MGTQRREEPSSDCTSGHGSAARKADLASCLTKAPVLSACGSRGQAKSNSVLAGRLPRCICRYRQISGHSDHAQRCPASLIGPVWGQARQIGPSIMGSEGEVEQSLRRPCRSLSAGFLISYERGVAVNPASFCAQLKVLASPYKPCGAYLLC
jgi:hypothetical protein